MAQAELHVIAQALSGAGQRRAQARIRALSDDLDPRTRLQSGHRRQQLLDAFVGLDATEEQDGAPPGCRGKGKLHDRGRGAGSVGDDDAGAGEQTEARQLGERARRVGDHEVGARDQAPPGGQVVIEHGGVWQHVMGGPGDAQAEQPGAVQDHAEPPSAATAQDRVSVRERQAEAERPVHVQDLEAAQAPQSQLQRQADEIDRVRASAGGRVLDLRALGAHRRVQALLVWVGVTRESDHAQSPHRW